MTFGLTNYAVLIIYLGAMLAIGFRFARKQTSTEEYFLAGRRAPWILVALSMYASLTGAGTFMGLPGRAYSENTALIVVALVSPVLAPALIYLFYPVYRRLGVTTSYEYIGHRFGKAAHYTVSSLFILARLGWLGTVIYAPALALSVATGIPLAWSIVGMGVLATVYTAMGGLSAVLWTDLVQFFILIGGAIWIVVSLLTSVPGGFANIISIAADTGHLAAMDWRLSLTQMTGLAVGISFFFQMMQDYGTDQVTVQRLQAVRSNRGVSKAIIFNACTDFCIISLLTFTGIGIFAFYHGQPALLQEGISGDRVLPFYIMQHLPQGISGLVITAVFAAAMSSMDSGINSLATVVVKDFVEPLRGRLGDREGVRLARILTLAMGVFATAVAFYVAGRDNIVKSFTEFMSLFSAPILALFLLGMLTRRGRFGGWVIGVLVGLPFTLWLQRGTDVHWIHYFPASFMTTFVIAYGASFLMKGRALEPSVTVWDKKDEQ